MSEQLSRFAVAELFTTDQLLELALLQCSGALDEFCLEGVVGVLDGWLE